MCPDFSRIKQRISFAVNIMLERWRIGIAQNQVDQGQALQMLIVNEKCGSETHDNY